MTWIERTIEKHKPKDKEASVCGILLYTDSHPHTKKVVYDDDYWRAFEEISGERWAIFCTRAEQGRIDYPKMPLGTVGYMVPIWREPRQNKDILEVFELDSTERLPVLVVFSLNKDGECLKTEIKIDESSEQKAYESLRKAIQTVTDALEDIEDENLKNTLGVHAAISMSVEHQRNWERVRKGVKLWERLRATI